MWAQAGKQRSLSPEGHDEPTASLSRPMLATAQIGSMRAYKHRNRKHGMKTVRTSLVLTFAHVSTLAFLFLPRNRQDCRVAPHNSPSSPSAKPLMQTGHSPSAYVCSTCRGAGHRALKLKRLVASGSLWPGSGFHQAAL